MPLHKKHIVGLAVFGLIAAIIGPENLFSSLRIESVLADTTGGKTENIFTQTANLAATLATVMQFLSFIIFAFLQFLLDPLFTLEVMASGPLQNIWRYSRDVMNIIFAFMLLAAGVFTVVTGNQEFVKQKFKQFILAVILVNFSWFFPRVILDVANVLTATIYQLPAGITTNGQVECTMPPEREGEAAKKCQIIQEVKFFSGCDSLTEEDGFNGRILDGLICYKSVDWDTNTNTAYGMINGLVMNFGKLPVLTRVIQKPSTPGDAGTDDERLQEYLIFLIHLLFILVLMMMLFLPLAAMFVVFMIRIPIIWVTIAFMPFMFIGFVIGDKMGKFDTMEIFKHFVKAAFLPAAVAIPFAAGFIVLGQLHAVACPTDLPGVAEILCSPTGPIVYGTNTLWQLLLMLISFFILWQGFWMAISIDDIYVNATSGIKSLGESVGKTAIKLPLSAPVLPIGKKGEMKSVLGLDDAVRRVNANLSSGEGPIKSILGGSGDATGPSDDVAQNTNKLVNAINSGNKDIANAISDYTQSTPTSAEFNTRITDDLKNNGRLSQAMKGIGIKDPSKMTPSQVIQQLKDSTDSTIKTAMGKIQDI